MPALQARDTKSGPNVGLIVALIVGALILIGVLVALLIFMLKRRRAARTNPRPAPIMSSPRSRPGDLTLDMIKTTANPWDPLLQDAAPSNWVPQHHVQDSYGGEDYELGSPTSPTRENPCTRRWSWSSSTPPPSPALASADSCDSESMYSERSASASTRMHTVDLASPAPPVPALPEPPTAPLVPVPNATRPAPTSTPASRSDTNASLDSDDLSPLPLVPYPPSHTRFLLPLSELPPEVPPLARGDTVLVSHLLKSRAAKRGSGPERSFTRISRIERADSIREAPSPGGDVDARRPTLDPGFAGTLE
ncbi:hypothetical protein B0H14DRAFT_2837471 [Mycena olivaceomarginata]|nr:hypothetical protein B0H14DRAFT_2837471 [Mycena olivaceomarginata]